MIKVNIIRDGRGFIKQIIVKGHAGFAEEGRDLVCAAASVTAYTAAGALGDLAGLENCYTENRGNMVISLPEEISEEQEKTAGIILETATIGFKQIELSYGDYISVLDEEV
jgi:uncharacterized protein YsxB (DUF464 family)